MSDLMFGLDTFGDVPEDDSGTRVSYAVAIRQVLDEAVLADEIGVDAFAVGEHHRPEFSISAPETMLAGIATRTNRIRLASGVTVLSSDDPVRVFQRFSTVDALSNGRAEVILGRGSFTESFPLFGYDLRDYDVLFEEKIALFAKLLEEKPVTWSGTMRAPRSCLPSSAVRPNASPPTSTSTDAPQSSSGRLLIRSGCTRPALSPTQTSRPGNCIGRTTGSCVIASARCVAGRRYARRSTKARSSTAPCTSARRRRSPAGSPVPSRRSALDGSISSTPPAHSRSALVCAPWSCTAQR